MLVLCVLTHCVQLKMVSLQWGSLATQADLVGSLPGHSTPPKKDVEDGSDCTDLDAAQNRGSQISPDNSPVGKEKLMRHLQEASRPR